MISSSLVPKQISSELLNWKFDFQEAGLSSSIQIDEIASKNSLFRPPTIVFSKNYCEITQKNSKMKLTFNAVEALKFINYEKRKQSYRGLNQEPMVNSINYLPEKLKVKHAAKWQNIQKPKDIQISQIQQSSDSFFVTPFRGHIEGDVKIQRVEESVIPLKKLGENNKIVFYQQGSLYEDELDDNGLIQYEYKFRTMEKSWFGLIRNYVRVDEVIVLILDTRIYWQQGWNKFARQFMVKKSSWESLKSNGYDFTPGWNMNPNQSHLVYPFLSEILVENQYIHYKA